MVAYVQVPESDGFRQGDVLSVRWSDNESDDRQLAVLVTADCDIVQGKMGAYYTIVSVIDVRDYISQIWMVAQLERAATKESEDLIAVVARNNEGNVDSVSKHNFLDWIDSCDPREIAEKIESGNDKLLQRVIWLKEVRKLIAASFSLEELYLRTKIGRDGKKISNVRRDIEEAVRNLPVEYLFLPALPDRTNYGHVALLRDIRAISKMSLYKSAVQEKTSALAFPAGHRLCRLSDTFRFGLAQRFAWLFSRIGLPAAYEEERDLIAQAVSETFKDL